MSSPPLTDAEKRFLDLSDTLKAQGLIPQQTAITAMQFIGKQLQGVTTRDRTKTISRLRNKAAEFHALNNAIGETYALLIEELCASWEDFTPLE